MTLIPNVKVVIDVKMPTAEALTVTKLVPPVDGRAKLMLKATGTIAIAPNAANVRIYFRSDFATREAEVSPVTVSPVVDNEVTVEVDVPKYGKSGFFNAKVED